MKISLNCVYAAYSQAYYQLVRDDPRLRHVERAADIYRAKEEGKVGIILWARGLDMIRDRLAHLETLFRLGYRVLQLTYSDRNFIGDGCIEDSDVGLSRFGRSVVKELNRLGIVLDVSHAGPRTALDAAELTEKPMIVSHANPRSLYNHPRNIKDELIRTVAEKGGVIGLTSYWGGTPKIKTLIFRTLPEDASRVAALEAGELDIAISIPVGATERIKNNPALKLHVIDGLPFAIYLYTTADIYATRAELPFVPRVDQVIWLHDIALN